MDSVVVHIEGQSHNEERSLTLAQKKNTDGSVLVITDVDHVVLGLDGNPFVLEMEVDVGEVVVALGDNVSLRKFVLITSHLVVEFDEEVAKEGRREDNSTCASIKDGVSGTFIDGSLFTLDATPGPLVLGRADGETIAF